MPAHQVCGLPAARPSKHAKECTQWQPEVQDDDARSKIEGPRHDPSITDAVATTTTIITRTATTRGRMHNATTTKNPTAKMHIGTMKQNMSQPDGTHGALKDK